MHLFTRFGAAALTIGATLLCAAGPAAAEKAMIQPAAAAMPAVDHHAEPAGQGEGWTPLFDGRTLTGWTTSGDPEAWGVRDGEIVTLKPGHGWWLRTTRMYRDFELTVDFFMPQNGNSGLGLRGSSVGDPAFTGFEIQMLDTFGEDPKLTNCGAVYDAVAPLAMAVNKPGNWNTYRVRLIGDTLNVWLNGVRIHNDVKLDSRGFVHTEDQPWALADRCPTGFIALQDHGHAFRYRNIAIRDLSADAEPEGFRPIFDGKSTDGWEARGGGTWKVEGGTLIGRDGPGHLFTTERFTDFEIRALVCVNTRGNSGLYFRVEPRPEDPETWPLGYEAQVDQHDPKNFTGCVYDKAWPGEGSAVKGPLTRDNAWFDYRVRAVGDHVQTWVNGVPIVDARLNDFAQGRIALQTHHQGNQIMWRDLRVLDLSGAAR